MLAEWERQNSWWHRLNKQTINFWARSCYLGWLYNPEEQHTCRSARLPSAFCCQMLPEVSSRVILVFQVISTGVFKFLLSIFYLLDKNFNQSDVPKPLKIRCVNESWRTGSLSAHSILFAVFWISFDASVLHALRHLATWISGSYSCEGQFPASWQVVHRGDVPHLHFANPFLLAALQTSVSVPSPASCPCSLGLLHGWTGLPCRSKVISCVTWNFMHLWRQVFWLCLSLLCSFSYPGWPFRMLWRLKEPENPDCQGNIILIFHNRGISPVITPLVFCRGHLEIHQSVCRKELWDWNPDFIFLDLGVPSCKEPQGFTNVGQ